MDQSYAGEVRGPQVPDWLLRHRLNPTSFAELCLRGVRCLTPWGPGGDFWSTSPAEFTVDGALWDSVSPAPGPETVADVRSEIASAGWMHVRRAQLAGRDGWLATASVGAGSATVRRVATLRVQWGASRYTVYVVSCSQGGVEEYGGLFTP